MSDSVAYPLATGRTIATSEKILLKATGSFLTMAYQYQSLTGNKTWAPSHAKLFQRFADYLKSNGQYPISQCDTVDSNNPTAKQTDLAITSAIGLNAYGSLTSDQTYTQTAQELASMIFRQGLGTDFYSSGTYFHSNGTLTKRTSKHFTYNYGDSAS